MSTIVVVKKNGKAVIAADSRFTQGRNTVCDAKYKANFDKIHQFGDTYIGISGSSAHHDVFESILENHRRDLSFQSRRDVFKTYLKIHQFLKEEFYVLTHEEDKEQPYESSQITALLANPCGIFEMYSYREVTEYNRFWAIGTGCDYALGALFAVYDQLDNAEAIARVAVTAAAEFDNATALPMSIYAVELREPSAGKRPLSS
jgi:ATP-dependent protease HslVU (ClpYQ) peptidase subunit